MGLLTNPCQNPDCKARVRKNARFCSGCGWAGANTLRHCPDCQKQVGRLISFCCHCGADLRKQPAPRVSGHRWIRDEEEFAVRIEANALDDATLAKAVGVEPGTKGLLQKGGVLHTDVPWGKQPLAQLLQPAPAAVYLVHAGDAALRPTLRGLSDAESTPLDLTIQTIFRVRDFEAFIAEYMAKGAERITQRMLEDRLIFEVHDVARGLVAGHKLEDMYGNLEWRDAFENDLRVAMEVTLRRHGLELLQVNFARFEGDAVELLEQRRGSISMEHRASADLAERVALRKRVRDLHGEDKFGEQQSDAVFAERAAELNDQMQVRRVLSESDRMETVHQARHELHLKELFRQEETAVHEHKLAKMQDERRAEIERAVLLARNKHLVASEEFERERERLRNEHARAESWQESEARRREEAEEVTHRHAILVEEARVNLEVANLTKELRSAELRTEKERIDVDLYRDAEQIRLRKEKQAADVELLARMQEQERRNFESMERLAMERDKLRFEHDRLIKDKDVDLGKAKIDGDVAIHTASAQREAAIAETRRTEAEKRIDELKGDKERMRADVDKRDAYTLNLTDRLAGARHTHVHVGGGSVRATESDVHAPHLEQHIKCPGCTNEIPITSRFCTHCGFRMGS